MAFFMLSETFHAVSKDYFSKLTRLLYNKIIILLNIMKLGSLRRGQAFHEASTVASLILGVQSL